MSRYVVTKARKRSWDIDDDEPCRINPVVDDHEPVDTGLISAAGEPIMRLPNPMGFGRNEEWA